MNNFVAKLGFLLLLCLCALSFHAQASVGTNLTPLDPTTGVDRFYQNSGILSLSVGTVVMIAGGILLIVLAVGYKFRPLMLVPLAAGLIVGNMPLAAFEAGRLITVVYSGVFNGIYASILFLALGLITDFTVLLANPRMFLISIAVPLGVFSVYVLSCLVGFYPQEAASISMIGGTEASAAMYTTAKLAEIQTITPDGTSIATMIIPVSFIGFLLMAVAPVFQKILLRRVVSKKDKAVQMNITTSVFDKERIIFPIVGLVITTVMAPKALPLLGMLFFGNIVREAIGVNRLALAQTSVLYEIIMILIGFSVGLGAHAEIIFTKEVFYIFGLGLIALLLSTLFGVLIIKLINRFTENKFNPLIAIANVAIPFTIESIEDEVTEIDLKDQIKIQASGVTAAGIIASCLVAGILLAFLM